MGGLLITAGVLRVDFASCSMVPSFSTQLDYFLSLFFFVALHSFNVSKALFKARLAKK